MEKQAPTYVLDEEYYSLVEQLALETEAKIASGLARIIGSFMLYIEHNGIEKLRSKMEYGLELLYLGVLYLSYSDVKQNGSSQFQKITGLYQWLESTKEFDEVGRRFLVWLGYWEKAADIEQDFSVVLDMTGDFLKRCELILGRYTVHIPEFIRNIRCNESDREDFFFITRNKNEYYINMVGAQILNHVYSDEFRQADPVYVFVPGCMAARLNQCRAKADHMGYACSQCTKNCPIHQTDRLARNYHAKTLIVYHSSDLYHTKVNSSGKVKYGVIGIACVLNLISGGLKAKELGYIPQCVVLDYCGCSQHWSPGGLVTDINKNRLEQLLELNRKRE